MKPNLLTRKTLSMELAERLADEAVKASRAIDRNTVVAVCDESGILKAFRRPDFTNLGCVDFAILKARTAVKFNTPTHMHWEYWEGQPGTQIGMSALDDVTVEGGGVHGCAAGGREWNFDCQIGACRKGGRGCGAKRGAPLEGRPSRLCLRRLPSSLARQANASKPAPR